MGFLSWVDLGPESLQGAATAGPKGQGARHGENTTSFYITDLCGDKETREVKRPPRWHEQSQSPKTTLYISIYMKHPEKANP